MFEFDEDKIAQLPKILPKRTIKLKTSNSPIFHNRHRSLTFQRKPVISMDKLKRQTKYEDIEFDIPKQNSIPTGLYITTRKLFENTQYKFADNFLKNNAIRLKVPTLVESGTQISAKEQLVTPKDSPAMLKIVKSNPLLETIPFSQEYGMPIRKFKTESRNFNTTKLGKIKNALSSGKTSPQSSLDTEKGQNFKRKRRVLSQYDLMLESSNNPDRINLSQLKALINKFIDGRSNNIISSSPHNAKKYYDKSHSTITNFTSNLKQISVNILKANPQSLNSKTIISKIDDRFFRETVADLKKHKIKLQNPVVIENGILTKKYKSPDLYLNTYHTVFPLP